MDNNRITTQTCKVSPMHYFGRLLRTWLSHNWPWLVLTAAALVMLSVWNPLFVYVGLMLVFLVFPMLLYYLWFAYALHPDCRASILSKQVELSDEGITCRFDNGRAETIAWSRIVRMQYAGGDLVFYLSRYIFFILPVQSFESTTDLEYFLKKILAPALSNQK